MSRAEGDRARRRVRDGAPAAATCSCPTWPSATSTALTDRPKLKRQLKVVAACGNGTAGAFAPQVLEAIGCEVVPLDCELDYTFPRYNPNPEDMKMLHAMAEAVLEHKADVGFGFDGDGDRCGVVDNEGHEIFADKVGVMLARDLSAPHHERRVRRRREVDRPLHDRPGAAGERRQDALLEDRPLLHEALHLRAEGARRLREVRPLLLPAAARARLRRRPRRGARRVRHARPQPGQDAGRPQERAAEDLAARRPCRRTAPTRRSTASSTRSSRSTRTLAADGGAIAGQKIRDLVTVNGVRVALEDGTWGLVRASSNKPELVVVVESPTSEANMRAIFADIDARLAKYPEVGEYNQKI